MHPIKGFLETSFSDWPGKVASVIFLPHCNFRCRYCHNHGLVLQPGQYPNFPWRVIRNALWKQRGWIDGVCLTGGEPTLYPSLGRLIRDLRSIGEKTAGTVPLGIKLDTNGSHPEVLDELIREGLIGYVAMDLKAYPSRDRYSAVAGIDLGEYQMQKVRASMDILLQGRIDFEFRTTVVPTLFEDDEVDEIARLIRGAPRYTLQNFNPREALDPELRKISPFPPEQIRSMQERVNQIIFNGPPAVDRRPPLKVMEPLESRQGEWR